MRSPLGHAMRSKEEPFIIGICGKTAKNRITIPERILKQFQHYKSPIDYAVIDIRSTNPFLDSQLEQLLDLHKKLKTRVFLQGYQKFSLFPTVAREKMTHVLMMESPHLGKFFTVAKDIRDPTQKYVKLLSIEGFPNGKRKRRV